MEFAIIIGRFLISIPYKTQIIAPIKKIENVIIEMSFALFLLNILYACRKFDKAIKIPNIVARYDKIVMLFY